MLKLKQIILLFAGLFLLLTLALAYKMLPCNNESFISYTVNPARQHLQFYWKDDKGKPFRSLLNLQNWLLAKGDTLVFAMNGGMYKTDNSPLGLYIEHAATFEKLNTRSATGNFYLKPNGVCYITSDKTVGICITENFVNKGNVAYATQSGPMLVIDGKIPATFKQNSQNLNIRNGVGILPGNNLLFAMSSAGVNFYDFAEFFKNAGCKDALYLDGFVSRTYLPEKNSLQLNGDFGVIVGVTK